ncbi:hypothetical protein [Hahella ganghwensis]|uniref:hypothetical protein n=1 Tax=Hahella ganghwensis TaxID=286420 RepID=UPI000360F1FC|nr:hypothetical protein [Hahella ganghwensis]
MYKKYLNRTRHTTLKKLTALALVITASSNSWALGTVDTPEKAKRFFDRIAGVPPTPAEITEIMNAATLDDAADVAFRTPDFYNVTLKNMISPWTNEDQTPFAPLNDYTATVIGIVKDDRDFRSVLYTSDVYVAKSSYGLVGYSLSDNNHYLAIEGLMDQGISLETILTPRAQALPSGAAAGVMSTRAAGRAFFSGGTNRAMLRFTLINHLCMDLEQLKDTSRPADRIRQDVSRSPGGDSSIFLNNCVGCHSGMDPLAQAFAYYDYDYGGDDDNIENGTLVYNSAGTVDPATVEILEDTPALNRVSDPNVLYRVQEKYFFNNGTFPFGYVTTSDQWTNYWRVGPNEGVEWNATGDAPNGSGTGANSLGRELANTEAFAQCHVKRVFKTVCLRDPESSDITGIITTMKSEFMANYNLKTLFALAAEECAAD